MLRVMYFSKSTKNLIEKRFKKICSYITLSKNFDKTSNILTALNLFYQKDPVVVY